MPRRSDSPNGAAMRRKLPPSIKKRVNVTIETIMEPEFEREDDEGDTPTPSRRMSSNV
jgi:hypothetical protein